MSNLYGYSNSYKKDDICVDENNLFYVVVPVYNTAKYISECIRSVLEQTYQKYQLILVNDGSTDNSGEICDQYANRDIRIHVIHQSNGGQLSARMAALEFIFKQDKVENSYIVFLDSDDSLKINALETIKRTIDNEKCDIVFYGMNRICNGKAVSYFCPYIGTVTEKKKLYKIVFTNMGYNSLCIKAISARIVSIIDYSSEYYIRHGEDLLQSIPYYEKCEKAVFINDILYNYTVNPQSVTQSVKYENYRVDSYVRETVWNFLQKQNVWNNKDNREYLLFLRKNLRRQIKMIACFDTATKNKVRLFDEIQENEYYCMVCQSRSFYDLFLYLFSSGNYTMIFIISQLRQFASYRYRKVLTKIKRLCESTRI